GSVHGAELEEEAVPAWFELGVETRRRLVEVGQLVLSDGHVGFQARAALGGAIEALAGYPGFPAVARLDDNAYRGTARREQVDVGISQAVAFVSEGLGQVEPGEPCSAEGHDVISRSRRRFPRGGAGLSSGSGGRGRLPLQEIAVELLQRI